MTTLYVGKFSPGTVRELQLRRAFEAFGSVRSVHVKVGGFAFVVFADERCAQDAYQKLGKGLALCGERMAVRWARLQSKEGEFPGSEFPGQRPTEERRFQGEGVGVGQHQLLQVSQSFCTICQRAGHYTIACRYNTVGGGVGDPAWAGREDGGGVNGVSRSGEDRTRAEQGLANEVAEERAAQESDFAERSESPVLYRNPVAFGGALQKDIAARGSGGGARSPLLHRGVKRRERSLSRGRSESRRSSRSPSVTRCSDSRCSCQRDRSVSLTPPPSLSPSTRQSSPPYRDQRRNPSPEKGNEDVPSNPPRRVANPGGQDLSEPAPPDPATVLPKDPTKVSPKRERNGDPVGRGVPGDRKGSRALKLAAAEFEKTGLAAMEENGEERKRRRVEDVNRGLNGKQMDHSGGADDDHPVIKRVQHAPPTKPAFPAPPPQEPHLFRTPPKRLQLATLQRDDVVIPRITEWRFEEASDRNEDGEISCGENGRTSDLPARLRPIWWRNIGKEVARGRGWKKGLEILSREGKGMGRIGRVESNENGNGNNGKV